MLSALFSLDTNANAHPPCKERVADSRTRNSVSRNIFLHSILSPSLYSLRLSGETRSQETPNGVHIALYLLSPKHSIHDQNSSVMNSWRNTPVSIAKKVQKLLPCALTKFPSMLSIHLPFRLSHRSHFSSIKSPKVQIREISPGGRFQFLAWNATRPSLSLQTG